MHVPFCSQRRSAGRSLTSKGGLVRRRLTRVEAAKSVSRLRVKDGRQLGAHAGRRAGWCVCMSVTKGRRLAALEKGDFGSPHRLPIGVARTLKRGWSAAPARLVGLPCPSTGAGPGEPLRWRRWAMVGVLAPFGVLDQHRPSPGLQRSIARQFLFGHVVPMLAVTIDESSCVAVSRS